jgi:osmotically-inducible protein OsmY
MERKINKTIFNDGTMSNRARAVRIICRNGEVTLKGSVPTTMEKQKIEDNAATVAGSANVVDHIQVKHRNYIG